METGRCSKHLGGDEGVRNPPCRAVVSPIHASVLTRSVHMTMTRRRFLQTSAAIGVGVIGSTGFTLAAGTDYLIQGLDVGPTQKYADWTRVKNSGKKFAFTKATERTTYVNPFFAANWAGMKSAGLIR